MLHGIGTPISNTTTTLLQVIISIFYSQISEGTIELLGSSSYYFDFFILADKLIIS